MAREQARYIYQKNASETPTLPATQELKRFGHVVERLPFGITELLAGLKDGALVLGIPKNGSLITKIPVTLPIQHNKRQKEETLELNLGYVNRFFATLSTRQTPITPHTLYKVFGYIDIALQHQLIARKVTTADDSSHFEHIPIDRYQLPFRSYNIIPYIQEALGPKALLLSKTLPDVPYDYSLFIPFLYTSLRREKKTIHSYIDAPEGQLALLAQLHAFRKNPSAASIFRIFDIRHIPTKWRYMNVPYEILGEFRTNIIPDMRRSPQKYEGVDGYIATAQQLGNMHLGQLWNLISSIDSDLLTQLKWGDKIDIPYTTLQEFEDVYLSQIRQQPQAFAGLNGYMRLAKEVGSLHLGHLWGLVKSHLSKEQFAALGWRYINLPYAKVEEMQTGIFERIRKNPSHYMSTQGLIQAAQEAGNIHLGYIWALLDGWNPSLLKSLQWEYIPITYEKLQQSLNFTALQEAKYRGSAGCLRYMQEHAVPIPLHVFLKIINGLDIADNLKWPHVTTKKRERRGASELQSASEDDMIEILSSHEVQQIIQHLAHKYVLIGSLVGYDVEDLESIATVDIARVLLRNPLAPSHFLYGVARNAMRKSIVTKKSEELGITTDTISTFYTNHRILSRMLGKDPTEKDLALATHLPIATIRLISEHQRSLSVDIVLDQQDGDSHHGRSGKRIDSNLQAVMPDSLLEESELSTPTQSLLKQIFSGPLERHIFLLYSQDTEVEEIAEKIGIPQHECQALVGKIQQQLIAWQQAHNMPVQYLSA